MLFAIGDIHGQREALVELIGKCISMGDYDRPRFLFIGDYIDRGPDSKGVVDFLIELSKVHECIFLRGNHEDMLMNDPGLMYGNGGAATLKSYGFDKTIYHMTELERAIEDHIPKEHALWFGATKLYHQENNRTFVHAGIYRHLGGIENQSEKVMLWVRDEFLHDDSMDGGFVVHGHTPTIFENGEKLPIRKKNRLNIDTGAAYGGNLTAAMFINGQIEPTGYFCVPVVKEGPYE